MTRAYWQDLRGRVIAAVEQEGFSRQGAAVSGRRDDDGSRRRGGFGRVTAAGASGHRPSTIDHRYSDMRIALQTIVIDRLATLPGAPKARAGR